MYKITLTILLYVIGFVNPVQSQEKAQWKEMDSFHEVMSKTFHPAEEGKFEPIRTRSAEMLDRATAWEKSTPPAGYNKDAVSKTLKELVKGAGEINKLVGEKATDAIIKEKLSALHDLFHEIMEKCEKE